MRKFFVTILCLVYFMVNTGFVVNLHFCMDKFHSWEIGADQSEKCGECGMKNGKTNDCCRDEVKVIKLQQDVVNSPTADFIFSQPFLVSFVSTFILSSPASDKPDPVYLAYRPPLIDEHKIYLENGVFRI